jgi:PIN domain nuclease of toxin-antitoxin system
MRVLVDTHVLLWVLVEPQKLSTKARTFLEEAPERLFSTASIWEIAIKARLGRTGFSTDASRIARTARESGFKELRIDSSAAAHVAQLPPHHRDPFDRLLIAQAMLEPARLLTIDRRLEPYSDLVTLL